MDAAQSHRIRSRTSSDTMARHFYRYGRRVQLVEYLTNHRKCDAIESGLTDGNRSRKRESTIPGILFPTDDGSFTGHVSDPAWGLDAFVSGLTYGNRSRNFESLKHGNFSLTYDAIFTLIVSYPGWGSDAFVSGQTIVVGPATLSPLTMWIFPNGRCMLYACCLRFTWRLLTSPGKRNCSPERQFWFGSC